MTNKKNVILLVAGALVGAISGYLYWKYVGCSSGTCMISSKPLNSTLYFAVMGVLVVNIFLPSNEKRKKAAQQAENIE